MTDPFDNLPCGYVSFEDSGTIVACNRGLADALGYTKEELTGKSIEHIFTLATRIFYNTHFFPLIRLHAAAQEIFLSLKTKDNRELAVLANARRRVDTNPAVIHCVFMPVEERKKFEQELIAARRSAENALQENKQLVELTRSMEANAIELDRQIQKEKTVAGKLIQFSKIISHDLQEPIRKILIFADMLANAKEESEKSKLLATKIGTSAGRLKVLTVGLQQYVQVDSEKLQKLVDINETIKVSVKKASEARGHTDLDLVIDVLPQIEGYPAQLELLFFHLADNAIKFRSPERKLKIKVNSVLLDENQFKSSQGRYKYVEHVRLNFQDNGIGVPDEYKNYVFELLKKMDNTTKGLGLGLPLAQKIVENHHGRISIESETGVGTRFEILLPLRFAKTLA